MIDGLCIHRFDEAKLVGNAGDVGHQFAHPCAAFPMLLELEDGRGDREALLSRSHAGEALTFTNRIGQIRVELLVHCRLVVEEIHLRRRP